MILKYQIKIRLLIFSDVLCMDSFLSNYSDKIFFRTYIVIYFSEIKKTEKYEYLWELISVIFLNQYKTLFF